MNLSAEPVAPFDRVRYQLILQILRLVQIGSSIAFLASVAIWLFDWQNVIGLILLITVGSEIVNARVSAWLVRHGHLDRGIICFVSVTAILILIIGMLLELPTFVVASSALLIVLAAMTLRGWMGFLLSLLSIVAFVLVMLLIEINLVPMGPTSVPPPDDSPLMNPSVAFFSRIVFVVAVLGVIYGICVLLSHILRKSLYEGDIRASEAEQARQEQAELNLQLSQQIAEQERLFGVIQELEVPIVPLLPNVVVLPLVGYLDTRRLGMLEDALLQHVGRHHTQLALIDATGIALIDTAVAQRFLRMAQAIRLLGANVALTGLRPAVARSLVMLDIELTDITIYASIEKALAARIKLTELHQA